MLSKLPGVYSEKRGVRIFSRIYYSFLFLIFVMMMSADKQGMCMQDKLLYILEMFLFFLVFAAPVPIIYFMKKKDCGIPEIMFAVFISVLVFSMASLYVEKFYTDEYKEKMYTQVENMQTFK